MAFEIYDLRRFLFLVLFAIPIIAATNIDCHGRGFHCVNSTHFMICVDLGIGISTTIDDFIIPCPPTTVCHKYNIFECEFPKFEITTPPIQVIGVSEKSDISEATIVSTSATSVPLIEVSSVTNKPFSILSTPEEITPVPESEVLKSFKEYTEAYNETSTKAEATINSTPSPVISEKVMLEDFVTHNVSSVVVSSISDPANNNSKPTVRTLLDKAVTVSLPDKSTSINATNSASALIDLTSSTSAPVESVSAIVQNSYQNDKSIINQMNDNNTLNQSDAGLNLIGEFTTTEKNLKVNGSDNLSITSVANIQTTIETTFKISEENLTITTEMTQTHDKLHIDPIVEETSTIASPINSLPTTDKQADPDPILINRTVNTETDIINKVESPNTTTSINLGSTNEPNLKFKISQTVFNMTINDAYNETLATTVSLNISGAFENHSFGNNGLTTPKPKNVVTNSIIVKNVDGRTQLHNLSNDSNITQEVIVHNDLKYNTNKNNVTIENITINQGNVNQRVNNNTVIAILESSVKPYNEENTTSITYDTMTILRTSDPSEDLQQTNNKNGTPYNSSLNATLLLNITENTILEDYNNTATVQYVTIENTATEHTPEAPIQNVTNKIPQNNSSNSLKANVLSPTVTTSAFLTANLTSTTPQIIENEVVIFNTDNILNDTTLAPLSITTIESQTVTDKTTTTFPVPLDNAANLITQSKLGSVGTTKAPYNDVLRETKPEASDQTYYLNSSTEPSVDLSIHKTIIVEALRHVKEPILKQFEKTGPTLHFEDVTTAPLVKTVSSISVTTDITTNLLNKNVDNQPQTQDNDFKIQSNNILRDENKLVNSHTNAATNLNDNNSSYIRNSVVMPLEVPVESTTSVSSLSAITAPRIQLGELTSTTETSQTKNTHPPENAPLIDDVSKITDVKLNQTSSFVLQDAIKSTITQGPKTYTTTVRTTNVDEISIIQKPILKVLEELLPSTPFKEKKTLPSATITITPTAKENVTMNLRDFDNLTMTEDFKTAINLESNHSSILKQEVVAPLEDEIKNNTSQTTKNTLIKARNEVTERSTFAYDYSKNSPPAVKNLDITTTPQIAYTRIALTPTVKISDASINYILPNIRSTEQPLNQGSRDIYNTLALNEVTTQQVLSSVTLPDSMAETIQVNGGQTSETSHLELVFNDTVIKNVTVDTNNDHMVAKHTDREYIENVTSIKNVENEAAFNFTKLGDIDEKIKTEKDSTLNYGNVDVNENETEVFSITNKEDASKYYKLTFENQNKGLSTKSQDDVNLPHEDPSINTVEYVKTYITTNKPYVVDQYLLQPNKIEKENSEIVSAANNTDVNLEKNNVNTTLNNQKVNLEKHNETQINKAGNELKLNTTKTSVFKPTVTNKQLQASNKDKNNINATAIPFNCANHTRGKYADKNDCRKFYTCVGNLQPLEGICPNNTVFSDINKQCTKNLSHCVRNNQFRCLLEGRFNDFFKNNIYYICVKNTQNKFLRYKFQCNPDYHLNKISVKCEKNAKNSSQIASSVSENSPVFKDETLSGIERETTKTFNTKFECEDEGNFSHSNDCSKYYECTKEKDVYQRKLKKCASDEVYDKEKKKCLKSDSTEC